MANQETGTTTGDGSQPSPEAGLLAALRRSAEKHRERLTSLATRPEMIGDRNQLMVRSSAVFDLIEILAATEAECAANKRSEPQRGDEHGKH